MQPHEKAYRQLSKKQIIINNFVGGIFWGIGTALGAVLLLTILGLILAKLDVIPFIGTFVAQVNKVVKQKEEQTQLPFTKPTE